MITSLQFKKQVAKPTPTNHIFVADVSGSMYSALPKIRDHLKNNLASLVKPKDTVSIIYFASKGQCGTVFVGQEIKSIVDLSEINSAIDRFLRPTGCTGFVEPLKLSADVARDLSRVNGNLNSLIFMTDGYDNCWSTSQILDACTALPTVFSDISFIEYGWYCNRPLLEQMAQATNALHQFSESYDDYESAFENIISANTSKRIEIEIGDAESALYVDENIYVVNAVNGVVLVPEHVSTVWSIGKDTINDVSRETDVTELYIALYYGIHTMNPDLAWKALKMLGDVHLITAYQNCFTKQDYSNVKSLVSGAVINESNRFIDGINYDMVPNENAITLIDVLNTLVDANALVDIKSEHFSYNRTGLKSIQKADDTIDLLTDQIAAAQTTEERKALAAKMINHEEWTPLFESTESLISMNKLVSNGSRPNISISTDMSGVVAMPVSKQTEFGLPEHIDTKIVRNYTIVKDGIINMKQIPVVIDVKELAKITETGVKYDVVSASGDNVTIVVHLTSVPLINRAMTKGISGELFMRNHVKLQSLKAKQKVLKYYRDALVGKVNAVGLATAYGKEAADWLSSQGIRDYGFSPKTSKAESTDIYMSKELNVKIKGLSSLPAVEATIKKVADGKKLNAADFLMNEAIKQYNDDASILDAKQLEKYIVDETKHTIDRVRLVESALSKVMYGVVVGKGWFADLDFEETSKTITEQGFSFDVTIELEEKEIKI